MITPRTLAACLPVIACVVTANAENWITSCGDGELGTDFDIRQGAAEITILRGGGNTYMFYAETSQGSAVPGVINNITVDPNATGDFSLLIEYEYAGPGAQDWNEADLRYAGGTSTVIGVNVGGVLADPGKSVVLERLEGSIEVPEADLRYRARNRLIFGRKTGVYLARRLAAGAIID